MFSKARSPQEVANKVLRGKDNNVRTNAPDTNVGTMGSEVKE